MNHPDTPAPDPWQPLRAATPARIALGRAGTSLPTAELLRFAADHARARDAVHVALDMPALALALQDDGWPCVRVNSRAPTREAYLRRPDWGRRLDAASDQALQALTTAPVDLAIVLADGLSATAVLRYAPAVLLALRDALHGALSIAPLVLAVQARVALGDEVGQLLNARAVLVLLGERPGLSSPDSLGAYLTHAPRIGCTDAQRNCVSNIRPEGLPPAQAGARIAWLLREALRRKLTGVGLKDDSAAVSLVQVSPASDAGSAATSAS